MELLCIVIAMVAGLVLTRLAKLVNLPNVTAYLVAGLVIGTCGMHFLPDITSGVIEKLDIITTVALGFIAFSIGGEFKLSHMKQIGKQAVIIAIIQAVFTSFCVDVALILFKFPLPEAITLGAIASATAPAATLMVVRQYKAKGIVTKTLLPVVALDDAVGLVIFSVSIAIAKAYSSGAAITVTSMVLEPLREIGLSIAAGCAIGFLLALSFRFFKSRANRLCLCIAACFLGVALSELFSLSALLLCIMIGAVHVNVSRDAEKILDYCDEWTPPLLMLFFVIAGAELDLTILPTVGLLGILYILVRSFGKYFGAYIGAVTTKADEKIKKYLGITLLPQAGVAIGMSQIAVTALPECGAKIRAVVLCATLVYELVGPLLTKLALTAAGEIEKTEKKAKKKNGSNAA